MMDPSVEIGTRFDVHVEIGIQFDTHTLCSIHPLLSGCGSLSTTAPY